MSTAKTSHGCLAEDYASVLADVLHRWAEGERRHFEVYPSELTEADKLRMDVADSFVNAVIGDAS